MGLRASRRAVRLLAVVPCLLALLLAPAAMPAAASPAVEDVVTSPPRVRPLAQWAPASCPTGDGHGAAAPQRYVVHHSDSPTPTTRAGALRSLAAICTAHVARGFDTIGYHYLVDPWGRVFQGRGALPDADGRAPATQPEGAHVAGSNPGAVGVLVLGDHDAAPPTRPAMVALTELLAWLHAGAEQRPGQVVDAVSSGGGTARFDGAFAVPRVAGHVDSNHTTCPGRFLVGLLPDVRRRVVQVLDGRRPAPWRDLTEPAPAGRPPAGEALAGGPVDREAGQVALAVVAAAAVASLLLWRREGPARRR